MTKLAKKSGEVRKNETDHLKYCVKSSDKININTTKDKMNQTPLFIAARRGKINLIKVLIELGVDINAKGDNDGNRALHIASEYGHLDVTCYLLKSNAKTELQNDLDETATTKKCKRP